jgi:DNA repair ATPase RecN
LIESIRTSNFQSLQDVYLEFGKFTVITGASSSGKSALTRALKAVASNELHSDNITRGAKIASVSVKTDKGTVTIERTGGNSVYKVTEVGREESRFARLNRQVPTEVTEVLGLTPSTKEVESINFAGQFDAPYLLKDGSSTVARVLGELTNVSTIFAAVKEASKRAKNSSTLLNLRKKDLDAVKTQIVAYADVNKQSVAIAQVEEILTECTAIHSQISKLSDLLDRAQMASHALSQVKEIGQVPEVAHLVEAQENLNRFKTLLLQVGTARKTLAEQETSITAAESATLQTETDLHETLVAAGTCPLCNQEIHNG